MQIKKRYIIVLCTVLFLARIISAQEFTSSSFKILDPVFNGSAGYGSSSHFQLFGSLSEISPGTSTSASFGTNGGFLFYPFASSPVVSATAGNAQVSLSWTASTGFLGWTASSYVVGQATVSGGPYSYTSLGNVLSSTQTGLSNGTLYYFIVKAKDFYGNFIATSSEVSSTPTAPSGGNNNNNNNNGGGGGGGGGGGAVIPTVTAAQNVIIKGKASPQATITLLKDGAKIATVQADANGDWQAESPVVGGVYVFGMYAVDKNGNRSVTTSFTANAIPGQEMTLSDIVLAPTIGADKSEVKSGNNIQFSGFGYPQSQVNIVVNSAVTIIDKTSSDNLGFWSYTLNSRPLEVGSHTSKSQMVTGDIKSAFSESLAFQVGDKDVPFGQVAGETSAAGPACSLRGDLNGDGKVNIVDFSILLYFWNQKNPKNPCADIGRFGTVDIRDLSIMLYWWTG